MNTQEEKVVDCLIIGQGISGTMLSYYLQQQGQTVIMIDEARPYTASRIASGLINPVTGKKWVTSWMAGELLPFAENAYAELGQLLNTELIRKYDLLGFHPSQEAKQLFEARIEEDDTYLYEVMNEQLWAPHFDFHFGIGGVHPCFIIDVPGLLNGWRQKMLAQEALIETSFSWGDCQLIPGGVIYKNITARRIILCKGPADIDDPYFTRLPFQLNKGEAIIARIPELPRTHLYKYGPISIVPWQENLFWIGSIFDREYKDELPTPAFRAMIATTLSRWLKLPYYIEDHLAAIRPATGGQKPFSGFHPVHTQVGIFNGMGSKACSQAPLLAQELAAHIAHGTPLTPEADISRFVRILSR